MQFLICIKSLGEESYADAVKLREQLLDLEGTGEFSIAGIEDFGVFIHCSATEESIGKLNKKLTEFESKTGISVKPDKFTQDVRVNIEFEHSEDLSHSDDSFTTAWLSPNELSVAQAEQFLSRYDDKYLEQHNKLEVNRQSQLDR